MVTKIYKHPRNTSIMIFAIASTIAGKHNYEC